MGCGHDLAIGIGQANRPIGFIVAITDTVQPAAARVRPIAQAAIAAAKGSGFGHDPASEIIVPGDMAAAVRLSASAASGQCLQTAATTRTPAPAPAHKGSSGCNPALNIALWPGRSTARSYIVAHSPGQVVFIRN